MSRLQPHDGLVHLAKALVHARETADRLRMTAEQAGTLRRFNENPGAASRYPMTVLAIGELLAAHGVT